MRVVSKKSAQFILIFALAVGWIFSGWPQIFDFPPDIRKALAALQYVGGVTGSRIGSTSQGLTLSLTGLTGGIGSSAAAGDIVVAVVSTGSTVDRAIGVATPTDFTEEQELYSDDTADNNLSVSWKIMGSTPDTSIVTSPSNSTADGLSAAVHVWRYVDQGTPFDVAETTATGINTGQPTPSAITPSSSGAIVLGTGGAGFAGTGAVFTSTDLSNFLSANGADTNDGTVGIGSFVWSSGTFTPAVWGGNTTNTGASWAAVTLVLRPARVPTVSTQDATSVGQTSATFNGNITATGGIAPTVRGFAWGTSATMVGDTATTTDTSGAPFGTGAFTDSAQTLACNTTYYYRPYAVNSVGTSTAPISNSFTTSACAVYSVTITSSGVIEYGFVDLSTASSTVSNGYTQTAQNDGNTTEKLNVKSSDATGGTGWTLASAIGSNIFKHEFSTTTGSVWTVMPDSATYVTAAPSVAQSGTVSFDFRLTVPSASTDYQQKSITITVQAVAP